MIRLNATLLLSFFGLVCLLGCQSAREEMTIEGPVFVEERVSQPLVGVWESRGYGWVLHAQADTLTLYDRTGPMWKTFTENEDLPSYFLRYERQGDVLRVSSGPSNATVYTFDRLDQLPEGCCEPPAPTIRNTFEFFTNVMEQHYAFFELHDVDWQDRVEKASKKIHDDLTDHALFDLLCDMLRDIPDDHLLLYAELEDGERQFSPGPSRDLTPLLEDAFAKQDSIETYKAFRRHWVGQYRNNTALNILQGEYTVEGNGRIVWGRVGDLGYINILSMAGYAQDESPDAEFKGITEIMSRVIEGLQDTGGMIVDITMNHGGYDEVGLAIAGFFAQDTTFVYDKAAHRARGVAPQKIHVFPAKAVRYPHPVALVTSGETVSAGETFTLSMRAQPQVTHYGAPTRGCFSDMLSKALPNGWLFFLSNEVYRDREGVNWERRGVKPTVSATIFNRQHLFTSHSEAILEIARNFGEGR